MLKIKDEHKDVVIGFNKSSRPLGQRDDLHILWNLAQKNKSLKKYFDGEPTIDEINKSADDAAKKNQKFSNKLK